MNFKMSKIIALILLNKLHVRYLKALSTLADVYPDTFYADRLQTVLHTICIQSPDTSHIQCCLFPNEMETRIQVTSLQV